MPRIDRPNTNIGRLRAFDAINLRLNPPPPATAPAPADIPFRANNLADFTTFYPIYRTAYQLADSTGGNQQDATQYVHPRETAAAKYINAFFKVAIVMKDLQFIPQGDLVDFGLNGSEPVLPNLDTEADITFWSNQIVSIESARIGAGKLAIPVPSLAQCTVVFNDRNSGQVIQSADKVVHNNALNALDGLSSQADLLLLRLWNDIESFFDNGDIAYKRSNAREWGVVYRADRGEVITADGTAAQNSISAWADLPDVDPTPTLKVKIESLAAIGSGLDLQFYFGNMAGTPPLPGQGKTLEAGKTIEFKLSEFGFVLGTLQFALVQNTNMVDVAYKITVTV